MKQVKSLFDKAAKFDKKLAKKIQQKYDLSNYQMLCLSCLKGVIIGAIIL